MNNALIKQYIDNQPINVVTKLDFSSGKLAYDKIVQCQKRTDAKPEELCRAYLLTKLVNELGYDPAKIEIEHEYTAGRPHTITSRTQEQFHYLMSGLSIVSTIRKVSPKQAI